MRIVLLFALFLATAVVFADTGIISVKSPYSVTETADRLEALLKEKGMNVFGRIDHAAGAKSAEMELPPTELVIFGNPKVGTPLMHCARTVAIDLPQKALIWEDETGQVWLGYNDPQYLSKRHGLEHCAEVIEKISGALANFAKGATAKSE